MQPKKILRFTLLTISAALSIVNQSSASYENLPRELKNAVLERVGDKRSLKDIVQDLAACRRINRESSRLLSETPLLTKLLQRSACWDVPILLGLSSSIRTAYRSHSQSCIIPEAGEIVFPGPGGSLPANLQVYLAKPSTAEERAAIIAFMVHILTKKNSDGESYKEDIQFFRELLQLCHNKRALLDFLITEAEKFYQCTFLGINSTSLSGFYSWRSLEAQGKLDSLQVSRFEKLKILVPFYIELLAHGCIPLNVPTLVRSQICEFGENAVDPKQRAELKKICKRLTPLEYDALYRDMYETYEKELEGPPCKRVNCTVLV